MNGSISLTWRGTGSNGAAAKQVVFASEKANQYSKQDERPIHLLIE